MNETKKKFAEKIADYVETNTKYEEWSKREAIIATVGVLMNDIGAANDFLNVLGVKVNLYELTEAIEEV